MNNGPARLAAAGAVGVAAALLLGAPGAHAETEEDGDAFESTVLPPISPGELVDEQPSAGDYSFAVAATGETLDEPGNALVTVAPSLAVATEAVELPG